MSKAKVLELTVEQLIEIAMAINKNTIENKSRSKEEKIHTDTFIRQFGINRKDFSETLKAIAPEIKYNPSTFKYDIPELLQSDSKVLPLQESSNHAKDSDCLQSNDKVIPKSNLQSNTLALPQNELQSITKELPVELQEVLSLSSELKEMLSWYREQKKNDVRNPNIIEVPELNINHAELQGEVTTKSFKTYTDVLNKFVKFASQRKETQKDLVALALIEFMERYKK